LARASALSYSRHVSPPILRPSPQRTASPARLPYASLRRTFRARPDRRPAPLAPVNPQPNPQLTIIRVFALLGILLGLGLVLLGIALGLRDGGLFWLAAAGLIALGSAWSWKSLGYLRRPTPGAAHDLITLLAVLLFSLLNAPLNRRYPEAWGLPAALGIGRDQAALVTLLLALAAAWAVYRLLKKFLVEPAFARPTPAPAPSA